MRPVKLIAIGLLAWPAAEIVAFLLVSAAVGFTNALFLVLLLSFLGFLVLRHFSGDVTRFRTARGARIANATLGGPGMAPGIAGILLLIPGFVTSLLGVAMLFPVSRRWLLSGCRRMFATRRRPAGPDVVDLAPDEWRQLPGPKLPPTSGPPKD